MAPPPVEELKQEARYQAALSHLKIRPCAAAV
jgi:hypothetical protein